MVIKFKKPVKRVEVWYEDSTASEPVVTASAYLAGDGEEEPPPTDPLPPDIIIEN